MHLLRDTSLGAAKKEAYERFKLDDIVGFEDCRLVTYNKTEDAIELSFEDEDVKICDIQSYDTDWLLEIKHGKR